MTFQNAKRLHNGDEVIDKETDEVIKVLSTEISKEYVGKGGNIVYIKGIGRQSGYGSWAHRRIR